MRTKKKSKLTDDSSRQIDEHFHRVSFREIKILWDVLKGLSLTRTDFVRAKFSQDALHYSDVIDFLKQLGILHETKGKIARKENIGETDEQMKFALVQFLLTRNTNYRAHINDFLGHFENVDGKFEIVMDSERRRQFGGLRNLLLELEFLEHEFNKPRYWIASQLLATFIAAKDVLPTSPLELQAIIRAREELGRNAELEILKFESARLQDYSGLAKRIKHVAAANVSAGYDILSFTKMANRSGFADRLIEVKAVSPIDFRFYWSRNEIEAARIRGRNYFLYLLPVFKGGFDIQNLKIIQNPFEIVYSNDKLWLRQTECVSFWPRKC